LGWRLPTNSEWNAAIAPPQYWTSASDAYNSIIKLHNAGCLESSAGGLTNRGSYAYYWSSTQYSSTAYGDFIAAGSSTTYQNKATASPVRCLRDAITISAPSVSNVSVPTSAMTATSADGVATVTLDGGASISERGICWNTTGNPSITDNKITNGSSIGSFTTTISGLSEGTIYYVRAYATNSKGTSYSPTVTSFKMCPQSFAVAHTAGVNGAAVSKTVTYNSISSSISGSPACWLTQNLGADQPATASNDVSDAALGWYFQFNRKQGYIPNGTSSYLPKNPGDSWPDVSESTDWTAANDPCSIMLGSVWRIPTYAEWKAADDPPQNWGGPSDAYNSVLKLNVTGWLQGGSIVYKGSYGRFWSSKQVNSGSGYFLYLYPGASLITTDAKSYGCPVRCIRP
jgi:hypothetical protein